MSSTSEQYSAAYLDENSQSTIYVVGAVFLVLDTLAISLRLIARRTNGLRWGWGDLFAVIGYVLCMGIVAICFAGARYGGAGLHTVRLEMTDPKALIAWAKFLLSVSLIYLASVVPPKISIIILYLSIFISRPARIICYVIVGIMLANWLAGTIVGFVICVPLTHLWDQTGSPGGYCLDINAWFRWVSLANIVTDVAILFLPIPTVWNLHCSRRMKLGLLFTFMMGGMGLICSIVRFVSFLRTNANADLTWAASKLLAWTVAESGTYLIACCLPTYRPLAKLLWQKTGLHTMFSKRSRESAKGEHGPDSNIQVSYELSQSTHFIRLNGFNALDDDSIGLVGVK